VLFLFSHFPKDEKTLLKITTVLKKYQIIHKIEINSGNRGRILISPFFGALFFGYMPIHSASRIIGVKKAYKGVELALVYWNILRAVGEPVAPIKAHILPYAVSYATYWNREIINNTDIRLLGVELGIFGISKELRDLMKEWINYHSR